MRAAGIPHDCFIYSLSSVVRRMQNVLITKCVPRRTACLLCSAGRRSLRSMASVFSEEALLQLVRSHLAGDQVDLVLHT